jgi:hypothetical protein
MDIVMLEGAVQYKITLDPSVWIFDDRKIEFENAFSNEEEDLNLDDYTKKISRQWDQETSLNTKSPPVKDSVKKFEKEKVLTGSFGIPFRPFLNNAKPVDTASKVLIETADNESYVIPLDAAENAILGFSKEGKPLKEDGPIHFYFGDGSNYSDPITSVIKFIVK